MPATNTTHAKVESTRFLLVKSVALSNIWNGKYLKIAKNVGILRN